MLAPTTTAMRSGQPAAVIDIGSNSVRLVVFDRLHRAPVPLFNEKVLCGLGRRIGKTGVLNGEGVAMALTALVRFAELARGMGVGEIHAVATSAVREASDGRAFIAEVERRSGVAVRIVSGDEEAELSALGVLSAIPDADGIAGDIGGGSVELMALAAGRLGRRATLPLGPFRLAELSDYEAMRSHVDKVLGEVDWLEQMAGRDFYAVGGAWRALARVAMAERAYPLQMIHHYRLTLGEAQDVCRSVARLDSAALADLAGSARRRVDTLPAAAAVLSRLLKRGGPVGVVFSAYGLREGLCFAALPPATRADDPLLAACRDIAARESRFDGIGEEVDRFVTPIFADDSPARRRLRLAACLLSDVGWRIHPDHRGEYAFERALYAPFVGIDHPTRVVLALSLLARYQGGIAVDIAKPVRRLIDDKAANYALQLGLALGFAHGASGGVPDLLRSMSLRRRRKTLSLVVRSAAHDLAGERTLRRLKALADALGVAAERKVESEAVA